MGLAVELAQLEAAVPADYDCLARRRLAYQEVILAQKIWVSDETCDGPAEASVLSHSHGASWSTHTKYARMLCMRVLLDEANSMMWCLIVGICIHESCWRPWFFWQPWSIENMHERHRWVIYDSRLHISSRYECGWKKICEIPPSLLSPFWQGDLRPLSKATGTRTSASRWEGIAPRSPAVEW